MKRRVIIVGGGIAGLTAALRLAERGIAVTIFERDAVPGGRIRTVRPAADLPPVDWGQHLMIGAYHATLKLADDIGSRATLMTATGATPFVERDGTHYPYRIAPLPAPLHSLPGILSLGHLPLSTRLGLGRAVAKALFAHRFDRATLDTLTARKWLSQSGQGERALNGFWEAVVVSTLNTPSHEASALPLATVLARGLFGKRRDALNILPRTTFDESLIAPTVRRITDLGGTVVTGRRIVRLTVAEGRCTGVIDDTGARHIADRCILTLAPWDIGPFVADVPHLERLRAVSKQFVPSPIVSVDLWYDRPWFAHPAATLIDGAFHWIFSHPHEPDGYGQRLSLVLSAADELVTRDPAAIATLAESELRDRFPAARDATVLKHFVIREPRATYRSRPGLETHRPGPATALPRLYLAGDWCATGLPATIEGAVLSGEAAARAALDDTAHD
ncbi:MAG TPA: hydroxysqualene dehydroxylase HpnE [bacterium]|nr:hydroxysqualene dehydroxylase HpnE [bacterium]